MESTRTGIRLADYEAVVGREVIDELRVVADRVRNRRLQNINSTAVGGGTSAARAVSNRLETTQRQPQPRAIFRMGGPLL